MNISANATMKTAQTVRYGPAPSGYPSVGSVSAGESVEVMWFEGIWCYICYYVTGTFTCKCGYVPESSVNIIHTPDEIINDGNAGPRYVRVGSTVYTGPAASGYPSAGSVDTDERVIYAGYKSNRYALIEYNVVGTANKKRAWICANNLKVDASSVPDTPTGSDSVYNYVANGWTITNPWDGTANHPGHLGLDLVKNSDTLIRAFADGVVAAKSTRCYSSNGYTIVLQHTLNNKTVYSFYAHMDTTPDWDVGDPIFCGDIINNYGSSGNVTGAHLHLGIFTGLDAQTDQYGYYRVGGVTQTFDDDGLGYIDFNSYRFFNPEKVISTNGGIIC